MNRGRGRFNESNGNESYGENQPTEYIGRGGEDQPTQYIGNSGDDQATQYIGNTGDDQATQYFSHADGYNPDADFAGGTRANGGHAAGGYGANPHQSNDETRVNYTGESMPQNGASGTGQFWAPLTPEERGYSQSAGQNQYQGSRQGQTYQGQPQYQQGYASQAGAQSANHMRPRQQRPRNEKPQRSGGSGWGKSAAVVSIAAILAILVLVLVAMNFVSNSNSAAPSTQTTAPRPTRTTSTPSASETTESSPITDATNRVQEEIDRLRQNPPALPGVGDVTSGWGTIPVGVVGKSPAVVQAELAANGYLNVKVYDRNGQETNSALGALGKVASIDPPEGQAATTDTQVNIYLQ